MQDKLRRKTKKLKPQGNLNKSLKQLKLYNYGTEENY